MEEICSSCGRTIYDGKHSCDFPSESARFDPFEALNTIMERTGDIEEQQHEEGDPMSCIGRLADIRGEVLALRAYITGMER